MTRDELLALHVGHRCVLTSPTALRCVDCSHVLPLEDRPAPARPPAGPTSPVVHIADPGRCPRHAGQLAAFCGPCRSERLAPVED